MESVFNLNEIYDYAICKEQFDIPTVQRGYVWKPYQIENLWDSLMRGYPIGAIVLSKKEDNKFNILDGQQRITSICLGMCKGDGGKILKATSDNYKLFIDLEIPPSTDSRMFYFRVITKSHPWGYSKSDNRKTLKRSQVKSFYNQVIPENVSFSDICLKEVYPYDSIMPIPFDIFVEATRDSLDASVLLERITEWQKNVLGKAYIEKNHDKTKLYKVEKIYSYVQKLLCTSKGIGIPALYLDLEYTKATLSQGTDIEPNMESKVEGAEEGLDEIENMFVRMNSAGTPLSGEELNYSMFKTYLNEDTVEYVEKICKDKYNPARIITIFYRLWKQGAKGEKFYRMPVKPKDFQSDIRDIDRRSKFEKFLKDYLCKVRSVEEVLLHSEIKKDGIPSIILNRVPQRSPEIFYMFLYRIIFKHDDLSKIPPKSLIGFFTILYWLGKGSQKKGHEQLLRNIFPILIKADADVFWSPSLIERAMIKTEKGEVVPQLPSSVRLLNGILSDVGSKYKSKVGKDEARSLFLNIIIHEKGLLLYHQREYINSKFKNLFHLDDTNVPFDWDHIFPQSLIESKKKIDAGLKTCYQTIGNFWACSYDYNRSFQDNNPKLKLEINSLKKEGIGLDEILVKKSDFNGIDYETDLFSLKNKQRVSNQRVVKDFIVQRNKRLVTKWFVDLELFRIIPQKDTDIGDQDFLNKLFKKNKYLSLSKSSDRKGDPDNFYSVYYEMKLDDHFSLYFGACDEGLLSEGDVEVGLISNDKLVNVESVYADTVEIDNYYCTYQHFTIISRATVGDMFNEVITYLKDLIKLNDDLKSLDIDKRFSSALKIKF